MGLCRGWSARSSSSASCFCCAPKPRLRRPTTGWCSKRRERGRPISASTPATGLSERIDKPRRRLLPEPHDRIFGLVESKSSLRGQPFGQVLCDQRWHNVIDGYDPPAIRPYLSLNSPACTVAPDQTVRQDRLRSMHAPPHGDRTALDDDAAYKGGTILEPWDREALMVGVKGRVKPWDAVAMFKGDPTADRGWGLINPQTGQPMELDSEAIQKTSESCFNARSTGIPGGRGARAQSTPTITLMPEYGVEVPLWPREDETDALVSQGLRRKLMAWQDLFATGFGQSGWRSEEIKDRWAKQAVVLADELRAEVAGRVEVEVDLWPMNPGHLHTSQPRPSPADLTRGRLSRIAGTVTIC